MVDSTWLDLMSTESLTDLRCVAAAHTVNAAATVATQGVGYQLCGSWRWSWANWQWYCYSQSGLVLPYRP